MLLFASIFIGFFFFLPQTASVEIACRTADILFVPFAPVPFRLAGPEYLASFAAMEFFIIHRIPPLWRYGIGDEYISSIILSQGKKIRRVDNKPNAVL